jgi:hypothetical protein
MGNYKLVFGGTEKSSTQNHELVCYLNSSNEIFISIDSKDGYSSYVCLDKYTAIKLHRELKKQISFIEEEEVQND